MMGTSVWERRGRRPAPAARASAWRRSGWWGGTTASSTGGTWRCAPAPRRWRSSTGRGAPTPMPRRTQRRRGSSSAASGPATSSPSNCPTGRSSYRCSSRWPRAGQRSSPCPPWRALPSGPTWSSSASRGWRSCPTGSAAPTTRPWPASSSPRRGRCATSCSWERPRTSPWLPGRAASRMSCATRLLWPARTGGARRATTSPRSCSPPAPRRPPRG